jgi:hypothetical protein
MSYRNAHRMNGSSPGGLSGGSATLIMLLVMLAAVSSGSLASRNRAGALPLPPQMAESADSSWTPVEVQQLIAAIEDSKDYGLDPQSYGLAALRSEVDQANAIWGRSATRQLDVLAHASALTLANDYRRRAGLPLASDREIEAVRAAGSLRSWLVPARG